MKSKDLSRMNEGKKSTFKYQERKESKVVVATSCGNCKEEKKKKKANGKKTKTSGRNLKKNGVRRDKEEYYNGKEKCFFSI